MKGTNYNHIDQKTEQLNLEYQRKKSGDRNMTIQDKRSRGFTIVELLIVIVVIGILAAIVIVAYRGVTTRANATSVTNLLVSLSKKATIYRSITGVYPTADEFKFNYAPGTTVADSGPPEARVSSSTFGSPSQTNGTNTIRYVYQDPNCGWFDWWDYNNNRLTTLSTSPSSTRIGC